MKQNVSLVGAVLLLVFSQTSHASNFCDVLREKAKPTPEQVRDCIQPSTLVTQFSEVKSALKILKKVAPTSESEKDLKAYLAQVKKEKSWDNLEVQKRLFRVAGELVSRIKASKKDKEIKKIDSKLVQVLDLSQKDPNVFRCLQDEVLKELPSRDQASLKGEKLLDDDRIDMAQIFRDVLTSRGSHVYVSQANGSLVSVSNLMEEKLGEENAAPGSPAYRKAQLSILKDLASRLPDNAIPKVDAMRIKGFDDLELTLPEKRAAYFLSLASQNTFNTVSIKKAVPGPKGKIIILRDRTNTMRFVFDPQTPPFLEGSAYYEKVDAKKGKVVGKSFVTFDVDLSNPSYGDFNFRLDTK